MNRFNFRAYIKEYNKIYRVYNLMENGDIAECIDDNGNFVGDGFYKTDFVLMQSTGLVDKNGKEIFEGDVIQGEYEGKQFIFEVVWKKTSFCLRTGITTMSFANIIENIEVIGNIYENQELLKK